MLSIFYICMVSKRFFLMLIVDEMDRILLISNDIHFSRHKQIMKVTVSFYSLLFYFLDNKCYLDFLNWLLRHKNVLSTRKIILLVGLTQVSVFFYYFLMFSSPFISKRVMFLNIMTSVNQWDNFSITWKSLF